MTQTNLRPQRFLRTFGAPDLVPPPTNPIRGKDICLLAYLRLQPPIKHRRTVLANLLWAENRESDARHSLTQAVGRLRKELGEEAITTTRETVEWKGELACDAAMLEEAARDDTPSLLEFYQDEFLKGLAPGAGTQAFENWAAARRVEYRDLAADLADRWAAAAEARGDWPAALAYAQRAVEIDPYLDTGHRRIMSALAAMGERHRALQHYANYAALVRREMGLAPQTETTDLADAIRGGDELPPPAADELPPPTADEPPPGSTPLVPPGPPRPPSIDSAAAEPRDSSSPSEVHDLSADRRKWFAAGVVAAASVVMALLLARSGIRAT